MQTINCYIVNDTVDVIRAGEGDSVGENIGSDVGMGVIAAIVLDETSTT